MKKEKTYCVYKHINKINGKIYIGQTCQKPEKRWNNGEGYKDCTYFYSAIQTYGWNNFEHEILFEGLTLEEANAKEKELIAKYTSNNKEYGYNLMDGGFNSSPNEETKQKISDALKGRKLSEATKEKISRSKMGEKNPMFGKEVPLERKKKFSKPVRCIETGIIYYSLREAERQTGISKSGIKKML